MTREHEQPNQVVETKLLLPGSLSSRARDEHGTPSEQDPTIRWSFTRIEKAKRKPDVRQARFAPRPGLWMQLIIQRAWTKSKGSKWQAKIASAWSRREAPAWISDSHASVRRWYRPTRRLGIQLLKRKRARQLGVPQVRRRSIENTSRCRSQKLLVPQSRRRWNHEPKQTSHRTRAYLCYKHSKTTN